MRFTDHAILLGVTKYSESTGICRLFGRDYGLISGAVRGATGRKNRGNYQPGNVLQVEWSARLAEHLGSLKCEMLSPVAAYFLNDPLRLAGLNSLLILTQTTMAEHDPHPQLYDALASLLDKMKRNEAWLADYARYELQLLSECGFRLELKRCVVTGEVENLAYVSPKSGCAVTEDAGAAYKEKLLALPAFLRDSSASVDGVMLNQALRLSGYFLEHRLFASHNKSLPEARNRMQNQVNKMQWDREPEDA